MAIDVKDKVALVTGAANGLGLACAETLAEAGAKVLLTDISESDGESAAKSICDSGGVAAFKRLDVTSEEDWGAAVEHLIDLYGGFDILVNNAGIHEVRLLADTTLEQWQRVQNINVDSVFLGVREAVRAMQEGGAAGKGGSIVNMSSCAGLRGTPAHTAYCASKAAVHLLTKAAALEFAMLGMNIRINTVHPAVIETPMSDRAMQPWADVFSEGNLELIGDQIKGWHPMGRLGTANEVANAVLYLASDAASFATGAQITVDGGYCA